MARAVANFRRPTLRALAVLAGLATAGACARVAPHQRETLSRSDMVLGTSPLTAGENHAREYREGSTGGSRGKAGGCGCN